MSLVFRDKSGDVELLLWHVDEAEAELAELVVRSDVESAAGFASAGRRLERLAWRAALRTVIPEAEVRYDAQGAPYLSVEDLHIGVAHTTAVACVVISHGRCGVDVESVSRDFSKVESRFMSDEERRVLATAENPGCVAWCAKEAMYKYSGRRELDFLRDLVITGYDGEAVEGALCGECVKVRIVKYEHYLVAVIA